MSLKAPGFSRGRLYIKKKEKAAQHGAEIGVFTGIVVGILVPPAFLAEAALGGVIGGIIGHMARGVTRGDVEHLANTLDAGQAALLLVTHEDASTVVSTALVRATKFASGELSTEGTDLTEVWSAASTDSAGDEVALTAAAHSDGEGVNTVVSAEAVPSHA